MNEHILDLRGLKCPLPALRTCKALRTLVPGDTMAVICTDPLAVIDVPHLVRRTKDQLLDTILQDGVVTFLIRKSVPGP